MGQPDHHGIIEQSHACRNFQLLRMHISVHSSRWCRKNVIAPIVLTMYIHGLSVCTVLCTVFLSLLCALNLFQSSSPGISYQIVGHDHLGFHTTTIDLGFHKPHSSVQPALSAASGYFESLKCCHLLIHQVRCFTSGKGGNRRSRRIVYLSKSFLFLLFATSNGN